MGIQDKSAAAPSWNPEIAGVLGEMPGLLASAVFGEGHWPSHGNNADLRDEMLQGAARGGRKVNRYGTDDPYADRIAQLLLEGASATRDGCNFDIGRFNATTDLLPRQPHDGLLPSLVVPYPVTTISVQFGGEPWMYIVRADERGRFTEALVVALLKQAPFSPRWFVSAKALVRMHLHDDGSMLPIIHVEARDAEVRKIHGYTWIGWTLLAIINDDRITMKRDVISAVLNRARAKRGKLPLPDLWRVDAKAVLYATPLARHGKVKAARGGGTHASPIAHARRAHTRTLPSGRQVFVRDCKVGEAIRHLRRRDHYQL